MSKVRRCLNEARVLAGLIESERLFHACMVDGRKESMYVCLHECLHIFKHYAAYRTTDLQHEAGEELTGKEVTYHDLF